jgi:tetratricopeptide (TPR) repeat protein
MAKSSKKVSQSQGKPAAKKKLIRSKAATPPKPKRGPVAQSRKSAPRRTALERAQELAWKAMESDDLERQIDLAQEALQLSPDCADAYGVLAHLVEDRRQSLELLELGLAAAERALGPGQMAELAGHFWLATETRPYMRVRLELAECLWSLGRGSDAIEHLFELLQLNPADNQGIRYLLAAHLLDLRRDAEFDELLKQYDEKSTFFLFSQALREFRRSGDGAASRQRLAEAVRSNRHVVPMFLKSKPLDEHLSGSYTPGDRSEAAEYLSDFAGAWRETPGAITWIRQTSAEIGPKSRKSGVAAKPAVGPQAAVKERLQRNPQRYGTIWQAAVTELATWMREDHRMIRPWSVLIVDHSDHMILGQELLMREPDVDTVFDALAGAIEKPLAGNAHRPSEIQVRDEALWRTLQPHLEELGIDCIFRPELEEVDFILGQMVQMLHPEGGPPGLAEIENFRAAQGAAFYDAAAQFFRRGPWRRTPPDTAIQVECPQLGEFGSGRWYAVVTGQSGQLLGLTVYGDLSTLASLMGGCCSDAEALQSTALAVMFGEKFEVPFADYLAAVEHHWPLASPEANPMLLCTEPGMKTRPLQPWELQLVEGCLRAVPDFVEQHPFTAGPTEPVSIVASNLKFSLSWVEQAAFHCGEDCGQCEDQGECGGHGQCSDHGHCGH